MTKWFKRIAIGSAAVLVATGVGIWWSPYQGLMVNAWGRWVDAAPVDAALVKTRLTVAPGYGLTLFAGHVSGARMLRMTAAGDLLVATPGAGQVLWLARDADSDGASDDRRVLLEDLDSPNGLDLHDGYLYVAEQGQVGRVRFDDATGRIDGAYDVIIKGLPKGGNHWKKTIRFGPDGYLYMAIGSSCNVCSESDDRRAALLRYTADGTFVDTYATGLRNSAGFAWRDADGELYATDNGRDLLGDDFPPCELNRIERGGFYGWPYANGDRVPDPDLGAGREAVIAASIPPVFAFRAHNAPLGIVFLKSAKQTPALRGAALVALHGSWNRTQKDGYKVVSLRWDAGGTIRADDFMTGFLSGSAVIGRPAELAEGADGAIYVSDDYADVVYKITPGGAASVAANDVAEAAKAELPGATSVDPHDADDRAVDADDRAVDADDRAVDADDRAVLIVRGATLFGQMGCQECHVLSAAPGDGRVALGGVAEKYDRVALARYLATPKPPMPPVGDEAARSALAAFLLHRPVSGKAVM
jgi:glucose/arabinose dehydrogenase/mono/diheme cytochrome c family protein